MDRELRVSYREGKRKEGTSHPVASSTMTVREIVIRAMPLEIAAAPINAYVPLSAKVPAKESPLAKDSDQMESDGLITPRIV